MLFLEHSPEVQLIDAVCGGEAYNKCCCYASNSSMEDGFVFCFFSLLFFFFNKSPHSRVVMREETIHRGHNSL